MFFTEHKPQGWLIGLAFLLAFGLRFIGLGALPLSDTEAEWALQALRMAEGAKPLLGANLAYILPTSLLFFLFGTSDVLARFIPALAGTMLVLAPFFFRKRLGLTPSLILSILIALDPGLIALSHQAGSTILAVTFLVCAAGCWLDARPRAAGIFGALALMSGASVWMGLLGLGLTWALFYALERSKKAEAQDDAEKAEAGESAGRSGRENVKVALTFGIGTLLFGSTLFLLSPNGLSAWLSGLAEFFGGWTQVSGLPGGRLLLALLTYQPLALLFGVISVVRGFWWGHRDSMRLSFWFAIALTLALLYPSRQAGDLVWALIPLWTLTALYLSSYVTIFPEERREIGGVVLLVTFMLVFGWMNYTSIAIDPLSAANQLPTTLMIGGRQFSFIPSRYLLMISIFLLLSVSLLLVALGWSTRTAVFGGIWGLVLSLGIYALGTAWGATGLRTPTGWELWSAGHMPKQAALLQETVADFSEWSTGSENMQEVKVLGVDSPALEWLLREQNVEFVSALDVNATPPILITQQMDNPARPAEYRGQDFRWRTQPAWDVLHPFDWITWSVFRTLPQEYETLIVWVRSDVFPDARESLP
ncbi:MAG: hypothetical protein Kow002_01760 [Anaerolineales bacterium]